MKKKIVLFVLVCILSACGAGKTAEQTMQSSIVRVETAYCTTVFEISDAGENCYVLNTNTKKIHDPNCYVVAMIKDENQSLFTGACEELYAQGYTLCAHCLDRE